VVKEMRIKPLNFTIKKKKKKKKKELKMFIQQRVLSHIKWVPCHHGMARPQVVDGGDGLQTRW
jgi:hypothetical protein